jgi:hypothetical protein
VTADEWVAAALDAAADQLGHVSVEDDDALDAIASVLLSDPAQKRIPPARYSTKDGAQTK